ncbi:hypothetical protein ACVNPS_06215 [Candidatus Bipolaricaulota sp. J31]
MRTLGILAAAVFAMAGLANGYWGVGEIFSLSGPRDAALGGQVSTPLFLPEAIHTNAAGLAFAPGLSLASWYALRFGTIQVYSLEAAGRYWGSGVISLDVGDPDPALSYTAYGVTLSAGFPLGGVLAVGLAWKGFFQAAPEEAFGWALDPAVLLRLGGVRLGLVLENAASAPIEYGDHREPWPWGVRGGTSLSLALGDAALTLVIGARYIAPAALDYGVGIEVRGGPWSLRAGYGTRGFGVGASLVLGNYGVHWALSLHPYLPLTMAVGASWGGGR